MYPTQSDEIVLVLNEEEFLLVFRVAIVGPTVLLWYDDVGNRKRISRLEGKKMCNVRDSVLVMIPEASALLLSRENRIIGKQNTFCETKRKINAIHEERTRNLFH